MIKDELEKEYLNYLKMTHGIEVIFNENNNNDYTRFLERKLMGITEDEQIRPLDKDINRSGLSLYKPKNTN